MTRHPDHLEGSCNDWRGRETENLLMRHVSHALHTLHLGKILIHWLVVVPTTEIVGATTGLDKTLPSHTLISYYMATMPSDSVADLGHDNSRSPPYANHDPIQVLMQAMAQLRRENTNMRQPMDDFRRWCKKSETYTVEEPNHTSHVKMGKTNSTAPTQQDGHSFSTSMMARRTQSTT